MAQCRPPRGPRGRARPPGPPRSDGWFPYLVTGREREPWRGGAAPTHGPSPLPGPPGCGLSLEDPGARRLPSFKKHRGRLSPVPVSAQRGAAPGRAGGSDGAQRRGGRGQAPRFLRFPPPAAPRERGGGGGTGRERSSELTALSTGKRTGRSAGPGTGGGTEPTPQGAARAVPRRRRFPPVPRSVPSVQPSSMRSAPIGPSPALPASVRSGSIPSDAANPGAAHPGSAGLASPRPAPPSRRRPATPPVPAGTCGAPLGAAARSDPVSARDRRCPAPVTSRSGRHREHVRRGAQLRGGVRSPPGSHLPRAHGAASVVL